MKYQKHWSGHHIWTCVATRKPPGCDGQTLKIWNRLCSETWFPPPVLEKRIPKSNGKERILGIPTVSDRIAQGAIKLFMEEKLDPIFHADSYGYRPGKSAHDALKQCAIRCWRYSWILEVDISAFFDHVRHDLVLKAPEHHGMPKWVILYCRRWMEAPMQSCENGELITRTRGTPQGGVISPLLANLFLHYAFDLWMEREYRGVPFERYADDIVVHCSRMSDATRLKNRLSERFSEVGLVLNAGKTNIAYIDTFKRRNVTSFTFLGYDFKVRTLKNFKGELYRKCMPGASNAAMRKITETIKKWRIHRSTGESLLDFARRYNAIVRGWIGYYGKFWSRNFNYRLWSAMQSRLLKWMQSKYRLSNRKTQRKLTLVRKEYPKLFVLWYLLRASNEWSRAV
ncbi:TPA: group II intron reverse transcriptase/maturase [Escherichia coli]|nr:group II intron reverse transcriptase/maturase [Escherichia coli]EMV33192.1 reverse transcriptase family protein [Escherichia coli 2875000]EMV44781.1 reverse transcriptase family protein [Escherichia coli 2872800]EMV56010.1 reverse transcriptase family protein [Escherichia coli 2867750]EMV66903.1 reverse transcriptase family protein [Escherichia coli 2866750]EMV68528.1 reverse transcriptase family protein [Escherichia coli 2866550]EMV70295.1 reverse transcriptase family protein [Escherichi